MISNWSNLLLIAHIQWCVLNVNEISGCNHCQYTMLLITSLRADCTSKEHNFVTLFNTLVKTEKCISTSMNPIRYLLPSLEYNPLTYTFNIKPVQEHSSTVVYSSTVCIDYHQSCLLYTIKYCLDMLVISLLHM